MTFRRLVACTAAAIITLVVGLAIAGTPRFGLNYTSQEGINRNLDIIDTKVVKVLKATATLDFASAAASACSADLTVTITGALVGDLCTVGVPASVTGSVYWCFVGTVNTVTVRHCNVTVGAIDPASGIYAVAVSQL